MPEVLIKGKCPKCGSLIGFNVEATMLFKAIVRIDTEWHKIECPHCGSKFEGKAKEAVMNGHR